jgi:hypothetical protein
MRLRTIDAVAAKFLERLTTGLEPGSSRKVDNAPGAFMAVSVECLHWSAVGAHFSTTHYLESNGDLVPDPDVELVRLPDGQWLPIAYPGRADVPARGGRAGSAVVLTRSPCPAQ